MAQITVKRSSVEGKIPATTDLQLGELAINTYDGKLFLKRNNGLADYIVEVGGNQGFEVKNQTGTTLAKGTLVKFAGTVGNSGKLLAAPFLANGTDPSDYFIGVVLDTIPNGGDGFVVDHGKIYGVNTSAYAEGTVLYASATTAGAFTSTRPQAPNNKITVAAVVNSHASAGVLEVRVSIGSQLGNDELVELGTLASGDTLAYSSVNGRFENTQLKTINGTSLLGSGDIEVGGSTAYQNRYSYTATAAQTVFAATYTAPYIDVYLNGTKLGIEDYTATNGTSVTLATGAIADDLVEIVAYTAFEVANALPASGGTMGGSIAFAAGQTWPTFNQSTTGSAATLSTGRTIALTGDVTYTSGSFNGSANVTGTATLASVGTAGTYTKVTTDAKGRVTSGTTLSATDIPSLDASKITSGTIDAARLPSYVDDVIEATNLASFPATGETGKIYVALDTNKTYRWSGSAYVFITSGAVDSVAGKTGVVTLVKADVGLSSVDNTADSAKNVLSATKLTTARTIGGVSFDGSANINLPGVNTAGNQNTTGTAANVTGTVAVTNGGTGASTLTANNVLLGNGTSAVNFVAPGTSGNVLTSNGTTWVSQAAGASLSGVTDSGSPYETSLGYQAGNVNTGTNNTFLGAFSGYLNTTGANNVAVGHQALDANTTGVNNVAIGRDALGANIDGQQSVAVGNYALSASTTNGENVAVGHESLKSNTTGFANVAVGRTALEFNTTGFSNAAIGHRAGQAITTGTQNTTLGVNAANSGTNNLTTGSNNIIIGYNAAASSATVSNEITLGNSSVNRFRVPGLGIDWTSAPANLSGVTSSGSPYLTALGTDAGSTNDSVYNTYIGYRSGYTATSGANSNTATGAFSLSSASGSSRNAAFGMYSLNSLSSGADNTGIGYAAGIAITTGYYNVAVGANAMVSTTTGTGNTAVGGYQTLYYNTVGAANVAIGQQAMQFNVSGSNNTAVGKEALFASTVSNNTAVGFQSGDKITTGTQNTIIGTSAASSGTNDLTTGSNNIILGYNAAASSDTVSNEITLGNSSVNRFRVPGLGIDWTTSSIPGPSSMTKISTITCSGGQVATFTGLTGYDRYLLVFENIAPTDATNGIRFRFGYGSVPITYISSDYRYASIRNTSTTLSSASASGTAIEGLLQLGQNNSNYIISGSFIITGMRGDVPVVSVTGNLSTSTIYTMTGHSSLNKSSLLTMSAMQIYGRSSASGFNSGRITLYGLS